VIAYSCKEHDKIMTSQW